MVDNHMPDMPMLLSEFDRKFFQKKLKDVNFEWSKQMFQCAGISYERKVPMGASGPSITIRLSEPLLKFRPRHAMIGMLLHEMIHVYLFLMNICENNGGHGPNFMKLAEGINQSMGLNIDVYHKLRNKVSEMYLWRCDGRCQKFGPFHGWVQSTCKHVPGPETSWWEKHRQFCDGVFKKFEIAEQIVSNNANITKKHGYIEVPASQTWQDLDDSLMFFEEKNPLIEIYCDDSTMDNTSSPRDAIKQELLEDLGETECAIQLIDNEFVDALDESVIILTETKAIGERFDSLIADFNNSNRTNCHGNPNKEVIKCLVCGDGMPREKLNSHLEGCIGIFV